MRKTVWLMAGCASVVLFSGAACSSSSNGSGFTENGSSSSGGGGSGGGSNGGSSNGGGGSGSSGGTPGSFGDASASGGSSSGGSSCKVNDPNADMDKDGWSPNQGDCNDCDPNVNPGAIDTWHAPADGGAGFWGNEDCSSTPGDNAKPCDQGLSMTSLAPMDGAKAIELCATASMSDKKYGVLSANYVRADGSAFPTVGAQVGIQQAWGTNVHVQGGQSMLVLSSGYARSVGQAGACNGISCVTNMTGTPPTGFPQDDPACPPTPVIADDIALELQIRVPTNASGYSFDFKFYSFEFPDWVCDTHGYNDQFVTLVNPAPMGSYVPSGSMFGNISFDMNNHPVSVNMGFFDVCDPSTPNRFAQNCKKVTTATCPTTPSPYCPMGTGELAGTGYDVWHSTVGPAGATKWLRTQAPAKPGSVITIRFAMWDAGNAQFDSTTLIDNFQWIATGGSIPVGTTPEPMPQ